MPNKHQFFTLVCFCAIIANVLTAPTSSTSDDANHEATNIERSYLDCLKIPTWFDGTTKLSPQQLDTLPGLGFDSLRNLDMGQVFDYDYSSCKTAMNGRFLIPESTLVVPLQESHYKLDAEIFNHWENYTSLTSSGVRFGSGKQSLLGGSFSREKQSVKINQINHNSTITRVVFRNRLLSVSLDVSAKLHPTFRNRVYEIAASIQNNDTCMADYLSELLIRDYGTHYISSVETGAIIIKLDYIKNIEGFTKDSLTKSAQLTFPIFSLFNSTFNLGFNYSHDIFYVNSYHEKRQRTEIFTIGGSPLTPDFDLKAWLKDIPNKMAITDRAADPLYYAITQSKFPQLQSTTAIEVGRYVKTSIQRYYEINSKPGCLHAGNRNFDFQANVRDDTKCSPDDSPTALEVNSAFGGTYQTCSVQQDFAGDLCQKVYKLAHTNEKTGSNSCPNGYTAIPLISDGNAYYTTQFTKENKKCKLIWWWCHTETSTEERVSRARYNAYWCAKPSRDEMHQSYLFGGYFTSSDNNLITGEQICPPHFQEQKIASDITICTSSDYSLASPYAVKFGGFFTCKYGNPLAITSLFKNESKWPKGCGPGFSQYHVAVDNGCEINVCLELKAFTKAEVLPPILPPFHQRPSYMPYWSGDRLAIFGSENTFLIRETSGQWESHSRDDNDIKALIDAATQLQQEALNNNDVSTATEHPSQSMSTSATEPSGTAKAALALVITAIFCFSIAITFLIICKRRK